MRHGHVYENRQKKRIPDAHKMAMLLFVVVCVFGIPWLIYGMSRGEQGIFMEGEAQKEEEEEQHERAITMDGRDWSGFSLAALLIMIAAGGGIGGGGVLVPTYIFVLGFDPKYAIPLSNCTILGSSISNCILNAKKRHPTANRPLIDWDIMLMMEPVTIAGSVVGTYVNALMPPWLLCVLLVVLLGLTTIKTSIKGVQMYRKESLEREAESEASNLAIYQTLPGTAAEFSGKDEEAWVQHEPELERLAESESKHSMWKLATMVLVTGGAALISIFKGGEGLNPFGVTCGSAQWWLISVMVLPFVLLISFL